MREFVDVLECSRVAHVDGELDLRDEREAERQNGEQGDRVELSRVVGDQHAWTAKPAQPFGSDRTDGDAGRGEQDPRGRPRGGLRRPSARSQDDDEPENRREQTEEGQEPDTPTPPQERAEAEREWRPPMQRWERERRGHGVGKAGLARISRPTASATRTSTSIPLRTEAVTTQ